MFAVAAMFFFLYSDEVGGHKNAIKKWLEAAKIDPIFRRKFVFLVYFLNITFKININFLNIKKKTFFFFLRF